MTEYLKQFCYNFASSLLLTLSRELTPVDLWYRPTDTCGSVTLVLLPLKYEIDDSVTVTVGEPVKTVRVKRVPVKTVRKKGSR